MEDGEAEPGVERWRQLEPWGWKMKTDRAWGFLRHPVLMSPRPERDSVSKISR